MVYDNLHLVENLLKEIVSEKKEEDKKEEERKKDELNIELLDKKEEMGKIDLEGELKSTGIKKRDFYNKVTDIVNDITLGQATLADLVQYVKKRKKREPKNEKV